MGRKYYEYRKARKKEIFAKEAQKRKRDIEREFNEAAAELKTIGPEKTYIMTESQIKTIKQEARTEALNEFAEKIKEYILQEKEKGNKPKWTVAINSVKEQLK